MEEKRHGCETCGFRQKAEKRPNSLLARLWRWHTGWCPGWKSYQKWLAEQGEQGPGQQGPAEQS